MRSIWICFLELGLFINSILVISANSAIAQIIQDKTLPTNSQVTIQGNNINIGGGTISGKNLFHSFQQFSIPSANIAQFQNSVDIQNIITRITGNSISDIQGTLKTQGTANLFLINPNGIIFGSNASLQIGGSFIASTARSVNFADGTKFSTTNSENPTLLTVTAPIGLQFGATAAPIQNQSQAGITNIFTQNPVGLSVNAGKTLALVGGDISLEGGNLTANAGRIELGSVGSNSFVSLKTTNQSWSLGYEGVQNFQNIQIISRGNIYSVVDTSSINGGGGIQIRGNKVLINGDGNIVRSQSLGNIDGADITITSQKLTIQDGGQVIARTSGNAKGGNLIVNASDSIQVIGASLNILPGNLSSFHPSSLSSGTSGNGDAGTVNLNTKILQIQDGGQVFTNTALGGRLPKFTAGTGSGGNVNLSASESVEVTGFYRLSNNNKSASSLSASTSTAGNAGQVTINTGNLIIQNSGQVSVSSTFTSSPFIIYPTGKGAGLAGNLNVTANSIQLDNQSIITSKSDAVLGQGGNINLNVRDLLLLRHDSQITASATNKANGGNININTPRGFVVTAPLENNDITANANSGAGGKISINASTIFGFTPRTRNQLIRLLGTTDPTKLDPQKLQTSDITAFSQQNPTLNGTIQIKTPDTDPSKGLSQLPKGSVDASQQIVSACNNHGKLAGGSFTSVGRGGIASNPTELLTGDSVSSDWISLEGNGANALHTSTKSVVESKTAASHPQKDVAVNSPEQVVEAKGLMVDSQGDVTLVAQVPTTSPYRAIFPPPFCE